MCQLKHLLLRFLFSLFAAHLPLNVSSFENRLNSIRTVEEYVGMCPQGNLNKNVPSREALITGVCKDWSESSCCSAATAQRIDTGTLYNFSHSHCANISAECLEFFKRDLCSYECSSDHGPWMVKTNRKIGIERPFAVPLCAQDCHMWWEACRSDMTCVRMWSVEFEWHTGQNTCPSDSQCVTFEQTYRNAVDFCESVWDDAWRVEHSDQCMHFVPHGGPFQQHNREVARAKAREIVQRLSSLSVRPTIAGLLCNLLIGLIFHTALWF
ncbi:unnamed protein product [Dicrocoelium dendriticum]|nr:unnamed protein product [Dicrocoelium dendriticum]